MHSLERRQMYGRKLYFALFMFFLTIVTLNAYISSVYALTFLLIISFLFLLIKNRFAHHFLSVAWLCNLFFVFLRTVTWNSSNIKINISFLIGFLFFLIVKDLKIDLPNLANTYIKFFVLVVGLILPVVQFLFPNFSFWRGDEASGILGQIHYVVLAALFCVVYCFFYMPKKTMLKAFFLLLSVVVVMLSGSRSNFLTIPFSVGLVYLIDSAKGDTWKRILKIILIALIIIGLFFLIGNYFQLKSFLRIQSSIDRYLRGLDITNGRNSLKEMAWNDFKSAPIWGIGWMNFSDYHIGQHYANYNVHNFYLQLLCEMGIVGFILFFIPMIGALLSDIFFVRTTASIEGKKKIRISLAYQIYYLVSSWFHATSYDSVYIILYFVFIAYSCSAKSDIIKTERREESIE